MDAGPPHPAPRPGSPLGWTGRHLQAHDWEAVVRCNRLTCERARAQHGPNPESHAEVALAWTATHAGEQALAATLDFLWTCQHREPFLFESAETFAELGRQVVHDLFRELAAPRRKALVIGVADYVAGGLERAVMVEIVEGLWTMAELRPGTRVKTLRGAAEGVVLHRFPDGRVLWRPKGSEADLMAQPGSLLRVGG